MKRVTLFVLYMVLAVQMAACGVKEEAQDAELKVENESAELLEEDEEKSEEKVEEGEVSLEGEDDVQEEESENKYYYQLTDTRKDNEPERRYEYDEYGKVIKLYDEGTVVDYEYDEEGRLIKETYSSRKSGKEKSYFLYEYNEYDELIKKSECKPSGVVENYTEYAYGIDGVRKESYYNENGVLGYEYVYTYEEGKVSRKTRVSYYVIDGVQCSDIHDYVDYEYDDVGNLSRETQYGISAEGEAVFWGSKLYEYDSQGRLIKIYNLGSGDDKPILDWDKIYDENDNLIREIRYMKSGDISYILDYFYQEVKVTQ